MKPDKPQRVALVTGSNRGIGLETAQQLARRDSTSSSPPETKGRDNRPPKVSMRKAGGRLSCRWT